MLKQDKFIAWFLIFQAVAGLLTVSWVAFRVSLSIGSALLFAVLIAAASLAGIGSLSAKRWAHRLGIIVFAVQVPEIATSSLQYLVYLGLRLGVSVGWIGEAQIGVNLLALTMFLWSSWRYSAPNNSFKPKPLRGSA